MKFIIFFLFVLYSNASIFSIAVCTTSSKEAANSCQESILKDSKLEVFILEDKKDKKFRTYLGKFESYEEAKNTLSSSSAFIKKQNAFVKKLEEIKTIKKKSIPQVVSITPTVSTTPNEDLEFKKYLEEIKVLNSLHKPILKENIEKDLFSQITNYSKLIVEVNSKKNTMSLKANNNEKLINIKTYIVSTAKKTSKKPLGLGSITAISLKPQWYPTENTLKSFKQKGINLPSVVPFGHKLNYMGAAKINLTHKVDGREVYRIHGTLNEDTIGTNESSGCIRMKNDEVIELASLLKNFADFKGYNNIQVILR